MMPRIRTSVEISLAPHERSHGVETSYVFSVSQFVFFTVSKYGNILSVNTNHGSALANLSAILNFSWTFPSGVRLGCQLEATYLSRQKPNATILNEYYQVDSIGFSQTLFISFSATSRLKHSSVSFSVTQVYIKLSYKRPLVGLYLYFTCNSISQATVQFDNMTDLNTELAEQQLFWKMLFEEKKLAPQLALLATAHVDGITYEDMPQYGCQVHVSVQSASNLGDNFMSDTFTVLARLEQRHTSKIYRAFAKVLPSNLLLRQAAYESHTHHHEMHMYLHFFDLLRDMHVGQPITLDVPDIYYVHIEEMVRDKTDGSGTCILLEDLSSQGYCMSDKFGGADYQHCHMALTSLAHYHALTLNAVRKWQDPSTGELSNLPHSAKFLTLEKTVYELSAVQIAKDFSNRMIEFVQDVKRPDLAQWLQKLMDERLAEVVLVDTVQSCGSLACILHGDFWNNNMLFKYADDAQQGGSKSTANIPVSLKLIDFQLSRIGHPITDILYFMYASAKPEVRQRHMQGLLRHYFNTLTADLQLFGVGLHYYTWQDFLNDYKKRSLMGLIFGGLIMSMGLAKAVVSTMRHLDEEQHLKGSNSNGPISEAETHDEEFSGKSTSFEETMKNMMTSHKLSDNPVLSDRLLKLITEVHDLHINAS